MSNPSEYTSTPWIYSGGYPAFVAVASQDEDEPGNALKAMVCDLDARLEEYQRPQDEIDANGFLIAASPSLLEAGKKVWERRGEIFQDSTSIDPYSPFGQALLGLGKAIKEAEGRGEHK